MGYHAGAGSYSTESSDLTRKSKGHKYIIIAASNIHTSTIPSLKSLCQIFHWHQTVLADGCQTILLEKSLTLGKAK